MHRGYIKLWRKVSDNPLWTDSKFTPGQAWIDLILLANHKPGHIRVRGIKVEIPRGYCGWSQVALSERWKWSRGKVIRFLDELETIHQIEQQKNNVTSLIKIINYDQYQSNDTTDRTANGTTNGQQTDSKRYTNKNDKNEKNSFSSDSDEIRLSKYLFNHIRKNNPDHKEPNFQSWAKHIDRALRIDKRNVDDLKKMIEWCQKDPFWFKNILSTEKLRSQYDRIKIEMSGNKIIGDCPTVCNPADLNPKTRYHDGLD